MTKHNSHFTDLMITKDVYGNADFIFGVDMNRMMIDNSAYSVLMENMTETAKMQISSNSKILSFSITRRQVKKELSLNSLGSQMMPEVFSNETIVHPVLNSIYDMREVPVQASVRSNGIKYLTASDIGLSSQSAGTYQYSLSISAIDGFVPTINKLLKKLYRTSNAVANYIAILNIPGNYDTKRRRAKISIIKSKTDEMSKVYVDALSYFKNLKNVSTEYRRASSLIASKSVTKESIGTFQKRLNSVISKIEALISKTGTGVSPASVANRSANSGLANAPTIEIKQSFNNTVSVECKDYKYVDYFKGKGKIGGGLNIYSSTEVKSSEPKTTYLECAKTSLEILEARGVSLYVAPSSEDTSCETDKKEAMNTEKYIGSSATSVGGLLKSDLSPIDLSTVSIGSLVKTTDLNAAVSSMTSKLTSVSAFKYPTDNITKIVTDVATSCASEADTLITGGTNMKLNPVDVLSMTSKSSLNPVDVLSMTSEGITTGGRTGIVFDYQDSLTDKNTLVFDYQDSLAAALSRTMVLVATQDSDPEMCATGGSTSMLKSLEWKSLEEVVSVKGVTMLCKQEYGLSDVANGFFLMEMK